MPGLANSSNKPSVGRAGKPPHASCLPGSPGPPGAPGVPGDVEKHPQFQLQHVFIRFCCCFGLSSTAVLAPQALGLFLVNFADFLVFCSFTSVIYLCSASSLLPFSVSTLMLPESSRA